MTCPSSRCTSPCSTHELFRRRWLVAESQFGSHVHEDKRVGSRWWDCVSWGMRIYMCPVISPTEIFLITSTRISGRRSFRSGFGFLRMGANPIHLTPFWHSRHLSLRKSYALSTTASGQLNHEIRKTWEPWCRPRIEIFNIIFEFDEGGSIAAKWAWFSKTLRGYLPRLKCSP